MHDPRDSWKRGSNSRKIRIPEESEDHVKFDLDSSDILRVSRLSIEEKIYCLRKISYNHTSYHDFILALLLPALLNVEKLVLDLKMTFATGYLEEMIPLAASRKRPFDIQPPFEALTIFVISHDKCSQRSTGLLASLLKLPAIQQISGGFTNNRFRGDDDDDDDDDAEIIIPDDDLVKLDGSSSPLISLDLAAFDGLGTWDLDHIL